MMIEKKSRGTLERCRDLSRTRKQFERSTPFFEGIAGGRESNSARKAYVRSIQGKEVYFLHRPIKAAKRKPVVLSFSEEDAWGVVMPYDDALVVTMIVANHVIHRILVNNESSANILYWPAFQQMEIERDRIKPFGSPLIRFGREQVQPVHCNHSKTVHYNGGFLGSRSTIHPQRDNR
jgi:hypothetical protein